MIDLPPELAILNIQPPWAEEYPYQRFVINERGEAYPLLPLNGYDLYNCGLRNILAIGNRKAAKSINIANKVARHMWEVDGAIVAVVCRTTKIAKIGVWRDLISFVFPGWERAGFGFEIIKIGCDPVTKMDYCRIKNIHGTISEVQLHSLEYSMDAEARFKGARFSMVWLSEADQFEDRIVFDILGDQLRVIGVPYEAHQLISDANWPATGEECFLHDIFEKAKDEGTKYYREDYDQSFKIFIFKLCDNPFLDPREKTDLERKYAHDSIKMSRFVNGTTWVKDVSEGLFDETFSVNLNVVGKADSADRKNWEVLTPHQNSRLLVTGCDTGQLNHSCSFICPRTDSRGEQCYDVFDELTSLDQKVSIRSFATDVWERVQFWQQWMVDTYKLSEPTQWIHWCDSSLFDFSAAAAQNDAQIFYDVSGGKIVMRPVLKGRGSIAQRIAMISRLFYDRRLFLSAHCRWNIAWARFMKPGRSKSETISKATQKYKHTFDSTSYPISMLIPHEMQQDDTPSVAQGIITT